MTAIGGGTGVAVRRRRANRREREREDMHADALGRSEGGEALPGTTTLRKPIFCRRNSRKTEERPPRSWKWPEKTSTAVPGGGGVEEVQLKPIYMHIYDIRT